MDKAEESRLERIIKAYAAVGGLLLDELEKNQAVMPKSMSNQFFALRSHTSLVHHLVDRTYQNIANDTPNGEELDGFRVKVACGVTIGLGNCKSREDAVEQVESGKHDEMIGQLLAELCSKGKHRKVLEVEPLFKEE